MAIFLPIGRSLHAKFFGVLYLVKYLSAWKSNPLSLARGMPSAILSAHANRY